VLRNHPDQQVVLERALPHPHLIAEVDEFRSFGALAVYLDLAAVDRLGGERAGSIEAGGPQPLVEADLGLTE